MEWIGQSPAQPVGRQMLQLGIGELIELSERLATVEGFVPKKLLNRPPAVLATLLAGNELGLQPTVSLRTIFEIDGRVGLLAEVARALVFNAGHHLDIVTYEDVEVAVRGRRRDEHNWTSMDWTWDRAKRAGLTGKQVWVRYPRQMLAARVTGELCRLKFPDVLAGLDVIAGEEVGDVVEFVGDEDAPAEVKKARSVTRRAAVKAAALVQPPAPAVEEPLVPPVDSGVAPQHVGVESVAGGTPSQGDVPPEGAPPAAEPDEPEPDVEPLEPRVSEGVLPQWQRRLHARVTETFPAVDAETRDAYRHAIVAVVTRIRDDGSVQSSSELSDTERAKFDEILDNIRTGEGLIARLESGVVEIRKGGWCYRVGFDPFKVTTIREAG